MTIPVPERVARGVVPLRGVAIRASEVPAGDAWLSGPERSVLEGFSVPARRADWRLGRWAAKHAVAALQAGRGARLALRDIEILAAADGAPEVGLPPGSGPSPSVSLSHRSGVGFAVARSGGPLGCDLERVEPRSERFVEDYFTESERALVRAAPGADRHLLANLVWSAKEAALKAVRRGLRADTRWVEFEPDDSVGIRPGRTGAWRGFGVRFRDGARLRGRWRFAGGFVWTAVADGPPSLEGLPGAVAPDPDAVAVPYR